MRAAAVLARVRAKHAATSSSSSSPSAAPCALGDDDAVAMAVIDGVCATRARAAPMDVVVSINAHGTPHATWHADDGAWSYDERVVRLIEAYVERCPGVVRAFVACAYRDARGEARASKFVRGASEADVAAVRAWRAEALGREFLSRDSEEDLRGRATRGDGGGGKAERKTLATKRASEEPKTAPRPAPPPAQPAWGKTTQHGSSAPMPRVPATPKSPPGTSLRDIMLAESRRAPSTTSSQSDAVNKVLAPKLPIITAELLRSESRLSVMDKFGKVRCQVCGKSFKAYDALEQHIGASHYGLNNPYAKVLEAAQIAAGILPSGKEQESRVALKLGDLVSSTSKTSNSMVNSLAAYFKTETKVKRAEKKDGISHGGVLVKSTNTASSTGVVLKRGKEREGGKKRKTSTLKKIILRERATRIKEENTLEPVSEEAEIEVEVEVRVGWIYVQLTFSDDSSSDSVRVNLVYMEHDDDDDDDDEVVDRDEERDISTPTEGCNDESSPLVREKLDSLAARVPTGAWSVRNFLDVVKGTPEKKETKPPKVKEQARLCEVCNIPVYGSVAWESHINGKAHLKRLAIRDDPAMAAKVKSTAKTFVGTDAADIRYAEQVITNELNGSVSALLKKLKGFQDRLYHTDKIKAKMRRRLLYGLREVAKSVNVKSSKAIIIAPNIEQIESEGGLDDRIAQIITEAKENDIPIVFALTKRRIGSALGLQGFISMVSILDYNGADDEFKITLKHAAEGRALYSKTQTQKTTNDAGAFASKAERSITQQSENKSTLNVQAEAFTLQRLVQ